MDVAFEDKELSIEIDGKIEIEKLGKTARNLVGLKYLKANLKNKYSVDPKQVYLEERRKAILASTEYVRKTANGLNLHSENYRNRGQKKASCPVCDQREDWLHVVKCCSITKNKNKLIHDIEDIHSIDTEREDVKELQRTLRTFLLTEDYDGTERMD